MERQSRLLKLKLIQFNYCTLIGCSRHEWVNVFQYRPNIKQALVMRSISYRFFLHAFFQYKIGNFELPTNIYYL